MTAGVSWSGIPGMMAVQADGSRPLGARMQRYGALIGFWLAWQFARAAVVLTRFSRHLASRQPDSSNVDPDMHERAQRLCQWRAEYEAYRDTFLGKR
jgi:hypothetical protein